MSELIHRIPIVTSDESSIHVYVEISYSQSRKREMTVAHEMTCTLLTSLLKDHLIRHGVKDVKMWIPKNRKKFADIVMEFTLKNMHELDAVTKILYDVGGTSIGKIECFIVK
ncbi:MAG: hypothetical protein E6K91_05665 [Thaumarchaeota archaeon]|nr:MAG: hypothetical protein E6K91_05665 [Nitrososphaerota archaeon]